MITLYMVNFQEEWRFLIAGGISKAKDLTNPAPDWISSRIWFDVLTLTAVEKFEPIVDTFADNVEGYKVQQFLHRLFVYLCITLPLQSMTLLAEA